MISWIRSSRLFTAWARNCLSIERGRRSRGGTIGSRIGGRIIEKRELTQRRRVLQLHREDKVEITVKTEGRSIEKGNSQIFREKMSGMREEEFPKEKLAMRKSQIIENGENNSDLGEKIDKHQKPQQRKHKG